MHCAAQSDAVIYLRSWTNLSGIQQGLADLDIQSNMYVCWENVSEVTGPVLDQLIKGTESVVMYFQEMLFFKATCLAGCHLIPHPMLERTGCINASPLSRLSTAFLTSSPARWQVVTCPAYMTTDRIYQWLSMAKHQRNKVAT